jgi:hypothetical protein
MLSVENRSTLCGRFRVNIPETILIALWERFSRRKTKAPGGFG